jgi:hypothetical protein
MTRWNRLAIIVFLSVSGQAQSPTQTPAPALVPKNAGTTASSWEYSLSVDGYLIRDDSYIQPTFTADHRWLHLEGRYNSENFRTGSLWVGYNFNWGKKWQFAVTPMIGGVFGRTDGIAPACEASLTYKKLNLSVNNEYVFDTTSKSGNFYYSWPQLTYTPLNWLNLGLVAQHTKTFRTRLDVQRGFFVGYTHKKIGFTTYVFNAGWTDPTVVLELNASF